MKLGLSLLGEIEICLDGRLIENLRSEKARALLFYIAVESDTAHRRDALVEMFWPEKPEGYGRNSLKQATALLKKAFGNNDTQEPFFFSSNREMHFNAGSLHWVDVFEFEKIISSVRLHKHQKLEICDVCARQLDQAATLYQDDFLAGFYLPDCQTFDEWVITKREYYKKLMAEGLFKLITYHEGKKEYKKACEYGDRLITFEPWSESNHRLLMRLLALSGKRSAALKQYHTCVQILESELGISPTGETNALFEQIKKWKIDDGSVIKFSETVEREEVAAIDVEEKIKTTRFPKPRILGYSIALMVILIGFIFTRWTNDNQGALQTITENASNPGPGETIQNQISPVATIQNITNPYGLLSSEACLSGERLLYIEDFQDDQAQGWPEIEYRAQNWDIVPDPNLAGNKVVQNPGKTHGGTILSGYTFDNAVWRIFFRSEGKQNDIYFSWHIDIDNWELYDIQISGEHVSIIRIPGSSSVVLLFDTERSLKQDVWHLLEISSYDATIEVWLDGTQLLSYIDPKPFPGGQIGIGLEESEDENFMIYFDNLSVCELSAPFVSMTSQDP